ncbi:hypothetical protein niasHT_026608 [Heterodera trifolii]|uniref:Uncharacterized protein n=1 Tax=Heterodera trifolii TaxID=157864 RepID=A0ABD2KSI2_9BILA
MIGLLLFIGIIGLFALALLDRLSVYAVVIIHGILIGFLSLLALLSACTAILAANALTECIAKMEGVPWNGDFIGDDIWLVVLVFGTDCSARPTNDQ